MTITAEVCTYADLQRQMREALRAQNPEWIQPDGKSPICDDYDSRFAETAESLQRRSQCRKQLAKHKTSNGVRAISESTSILLPTTPRGSGAPRTSSGGEG
jgi:hypothetical protein